MIVHGITEHMVAGTVVFRYPDVVARYYGEGVWFTNWRIEIEKDCQYSHKPPIFARRKIWDSYVALRVGLIGTVDESEIAGS